MRYTHSGQCCRVLRDILFPVDVLLLGGQRKEREKRQERKGQEREREEGQEREERQKRR